MLLRPVQSGDLPIFYHDQLDPEASRLAAFASRQNKAFDEHWQKILGDPTVNLRTIVYNGEVAGYVVAFDRKGEREVGYWLGKQFWGKGIATRGLRKFLHLEQGRPLCAQVAAHNLGSIRVLEKSGFQLIREESEFARQNQVSIPGLVMQLKR